MKTNRIILPLWASLLIGLGGCQNQPGDYCTVEGNIKGVRDGAKIELQDGWHRCKVVGTAVVKDGAFEIHPRVSAPTHVYLYQGDYQLQDFFLEPGTVHVEIDAAEGDEYGPGAVGTPSNDALYRFRKLRAEGRRDETNAMIDSVLSAGQGGPLALYFADIFPESTALALEALENLTPELADLRYVTDLKEQLSLQLKTEPQADHKPLFAELTYSDATDQPISLSSVVNDPKNRYVLLDFWATWCRPCVNSLPELKEAYRKYHDKGLEIYSVSIDSQKGKWKSFLEENGMEWINVIDDKAGRRSGEVWQSYAVSVIPLVLLIDGNTGEILFRENHLDLDAILSELLP